MIRLRDKVAGATRKEERVGRAQGKAGLARLGLFKEQWGVACGWTPVVRDGWKR